MECIHYKSQPNNTKLLLYKLLLSLQQSSNLKTVVSNRKECFSYKGGFGIHVLRLFNECLVVINPF